MSSFLQGRAHTTHRFQVTQTEATAHNKSSISSEEEPSRVKIRRGVKNSSESTSVRSQHKRNVMLRRRLRPAANGFLFLFLFISPSFFPSKYSCHKTHNNCNYADLLHLLRMGWFQRPTRPTEKHTNDTKSIIVERLTIQMSFRTGSLKSS